MKRAILLLLALLLAGAPASVGERGASAKGPLPEVAYASAVLALVDGEIEQPKLVWLNPRTLKRVGREAVRLSGDAHSPVLSPTGGRVAIGGVDGIRIADVYRMKVLSRLARRGASWTVSPIAWPDARRLFAVEWNDRLQTEADLVTVDPTARRVLRRTSLGRYAGSVAAVGGSYVVAVGRPSAGIGPARMLVIDQNGGLRSVVLDRISAGGEQEGPEDDPSFRTASPGLTVDPITRRAYVVGQAPLVAEVDLDSLGVTYRELSRPAPFFARLRNWLEPMARAKSLAGWSRQMVWLGDGLLAAAGEEYDEPRTTPAGLELIDVRTGTMRRLEPRASFAQVAGGVLLAGGARRDGATEAESGMGLSAYALDGEPVWHALGDEPVWWAQAAGGYAFVAGPDAYPPTVRVIDLRTGAVRTVRGQMPFFVTP